MEIPQSTHGWIAHSADWGNSVGLQNPLRFGEEAEAAEAIELTEVVVKSDFQPLVVGLV